MLRSGFIALSQNRQARAFSESSPIGRRLSSRFVAGMQVPEALEVARRLNDDGISVSLDSLGESVLDATQAYASAAIYHEILDKIAAGDLRANVSVKLTQMGMDFDPALAESIVGDMVAHAARIGTFVRIDMEGSPLTDATLALTERLHALPGNRGRVGTVLQAYLYRTKRDAERLISQGIRIRLCKGAYQESASIAFPQKSDVDRNYITLMHRLATSGVFCGIATHDERIIADMRRFTAEHNLPKQTFEFQMLYGVRRDLQRQLAREGFGVRCYVPFGTEWYPYFMRRLAERPANALFLAKTFFRN